MFNGRYSYVAFPEHSAALSVNYIFRYGINNGHTVQIYALYLVAMIFGCRIECHRKAQSCMQAFSA